MFKKLLTLLAERERKHLMARLDFVRGQLEAARTYLQRCQMVAEHENSYRTLEDVDDAESRVMTWEREYHSLNRKMLKRGYAFA